MQTDIIAVQRVYYDQNYNFICSLSSPPILCSLLILYGPLSRSVDGRHEHAAGKLIINVLWRCIDLRTQIGFSIGGIARRFLVQPPSMSKSGLIFCCSTFRCVDHELQSGLPNSLPAHCSTPFTSRLMQAWVIAEA